MKVMTSLITVLILLTVCVSCNQDSFNESDSDIPKQNKTSIEDSIYYNLHLYAIDTISGFKKYFSDTSNHKMLRDYSNMCSGIRNDSTLSLSEKIFFRIWSNSSAFNNIKIQVKLDQKGEIEEMGFFENTLHRLYLRLREDGEFDLESHVMCRDELFEGKYKQHQDTIFLFFHDEKPDYAADTLILLDDNIISVDHSDSSIWGFSRLVRLDEEK